MLTREQLIDYIIKNYNCHLMDYQKTALWEFYKNCMTDGDLIFTYGRRDGKMFMYQIMKELLEYEYQENNGINK